MPPPPPPLHKVWIVDCKACGMFLTNRGMKVRLSSDAVRELEIYKLSTGRVAVAPKRAAVLDGCYSNQLFSVHNDGRGDSRSADPSIVQHLTRPASPYRCQNL